MSDDHKDNYAVDSSGYLARAKKRLQERTHEALFYAAFELRCFVEARQSEYLEAQKEYAESIPQGWKIGKQGKVLEKIFKSKSIQAIKWVSQGGSFEAYHVPVREQLRSRAERLGVLMHAQGRWYEQVDPWWVTLREQVLAVYREAWICNQGHLLSPLFYDGQQIIGSNVTMTIVTEDIERLKSFMTPGAKGVMSVDYLDAPPDSWRCDMAE